VALTDGVPQQKRGHLWWEGAPVARARPKRYVEDMAFLIRAIRPPVKLDPPGALFTYSLDDVEAMSAKLGIVWGPGKT
jgi:hypothetical protein